MKEISFHDIDEVAKLHITAERQTYEHIVPELICEFSNFERRRNVWLAALKDRSVYTFLVYPDGKSSPAGFISGRIDNIQKLRSANLGAIYILKEYQYQGYGRLMLSVFTKVALEARICEICGVVPYKNLSARNFFASSGSVEHSIHVRRSQHNATLYVKLNWNNLQYLLYCLESITN